VITAGVDLAAESTTTGVAVIEWSSTSALVTSLAVGTEDAEILASTSGADKIGLDCPLGWPDPFVAFVVAHRDGHVPVPDGTPGKIWRHRLANRRTDDVVHRQFGLVPLSVSADRIARPAMRAAGLLSLLAASGRPVDRSGSGAVVEAYPAASLKQWGLSYRRYKGVANRPALNDLADSLLAAAPWLRLGRYEELFRTTDHAFDAVVAGLTARAAALGQTLKPAADELAVAQREGWIAVPLQPLTALAPSV
jgi:predicted nuclease with RNAse H fold